MNKNNNNGRDLISILSAAFAAVIAVTLILYGVIAFVSFGLPAIREKNGTAPSREASSEAPENEGSTDDAESASKTTEEVIAIRTTEAPPETVKRDDDREIESLTQERVDVIGMDYSTEVVDFTTEGERDANNRPVAVNEFMTTMRADGVYATCYASDSDTKKVAFTFEAAEETGHTEEVLNILDNYSIKSTFYVTHKYAANNADLMRRMISDGHELGNHSYTCPDTGVAALSLEDVMRDAVNMQNYLQQAYSYKMTKYNFNAGKYSEASAVLLSEMGYEICFYSAAYADADPEQDFDAEATLESLKSMLHPGAVYCFHMTNPITAQVLPALIEYCKSEGYTITQLD